MRIRILLCGLLLGAGCAQAADMTVLHYVDQDPTSPPYPTRILVTPDFMRMDSGEDAGDFALLDRKQRKLINVTRDNKLAMVFSQGKLPPKPTRWKVKLEALKGAPGTQRFTLKVNGQVCSEGVAALRASPDAARAMAEMKAVLAATQYRVWKESPPGMQHDCDLANQVFESGKTLTLGLPLDEREFTGRSRRFESESVQTLKPELFRVPDGMTQFDAPTASQ